MEEGDKASKIISGNTYGKVILTLENCLLPAEKLQTTPSELDGLNRETETDLRILGCELIQTSGILLKLPQVAMASGQVLFQRFFYSKSFVRHDMEAIAMSCICLASKIEEAPRRIRDVINVFHHIKQIRSGKEAAPMILDQYYINLKSQVIKAERRVLKELGFCVHVKHPHKLIVMYLRSIGLEENNEMMQVAWNFMNDSFRSDVFVRYQPETIACGCIYLTSRKLNISLPNNPPWFDVFKVSEEDLIDVCYRIMELYHRPKPNVVILEAAVEALKLRYQDQRKKERRPSPPGITVVERTNGSHNAWGGFISRTLPTTTTSTSTNLTIITGSKSKSSSETKPNNATEIKVVDKEGQQNRKSRSESKGKSTSKSRSHSRSRSRGRGTKSRSRSAEKYPKHKSRSKKRAYSNSSSASERDRRTRKRDKKYEKRSPRQYNDRNRERERDRYSNGRRNERDKEYNNYRNYDKDKFSSNKHASRGNANENNKSKSRDRRR